MNQNSILYLFVTSSMFRLIPRSDLFMLQNIGPSVTNELVPKTEITLERENLKRYSDTHLVPKTERSRWGTR